MEEVKYSGRIRQTGICLGKLFRMFIYHKDWKVLPMAALIAGLVTFVVSGGLFVYQEGTLTGTFALVCVCIWNGFFNSVQSVCRERDILKREHRAGLHMSSYVAAHMIFQMVLCAAQTLITMLVLRAADVRLPESGLVTPWAALDISLTLFIITFTADMMSLLLSSIVHNTTTAMTVMPFLLIFQLVFSGGFFQLGDMAKKVMDFTISKWGLNALCAQGGYNRLPMVTLWNTILKFRTLELYGHRPVEEVMVFIEQNGYRDALLEASGAYNQNAAYAATVSNVLNCWGHLLAFSAVFAILSVLFLKQIDRDRR